MRCSKGLLFNESTHKYIFNNTLLMRSKHSGCSINWDDIDTLIDINNWFITCHLDDLKQIVERDDDEQCSYASIYAYRGWPDAISAAVGRCFN